MRRILAAVFAALCVVSASCAAPAPFKLSPSEYMPVSQVRSGMKGYGLTVFRGVTIEKFGVEVIDVMPNQNVGQPLILIRMSGGPITERKANIIGGMSGSPVYINGRLIGAVAYGNAFPNEPVAMVTPIENMVDAFDPNLPARPLVASAPGVMPSSMASVFMPAPIPVYAGVGARALGVLNEHLKVYGLQAMQGGGGGGTSNRFPKGVRLEPGSGIGVSLMQGDVDITGIGTVTYREGDRILAFGHPMLQLGPAEFPACTVWIHDVFSSPQRSNKMGSPIETVGTILQDRPFSVGGLVRRQPNMVPLTVHVTDKGTGRAQTFRMKMVNHPSLTSGLVATGTTEVIDRLRGFPGDAMATTTFTVKAAGLPPITRTNRFFDANAINAGSMVDLSDVMLMLVRNPFEVATVRSVDVKVVVESGRQTAVVERAWLERDKVEPGETVVINAVVKPYRKPAETHQLTFTIPENAPTGQAQVSVFGGITGASRPAMPGAPAAASTASVTTLRQAVDRYLEREPNDVIGARMSLPGNVVTVEGTRFAGLPDVYADVMKSTKASSTRLERDELRASKPLPYVTAGLQMLVVNIERKPILEKSKPASSPSGSSSPSTTAPEPAEPAGGSTTVAVMPGTTGRFEAAAEPAPAVRKVAAAPAPAATAAKPGDASAKPVEAKPEEKKEPAAATEPKGPGRAASVWRQNSKAQFESGTAAGVSAASDGTLRLTPQLGIIADIPVPYVWSVLPLPDGSVLAGTGNGGDIYRVSKDAHATLLADTDALQVQCLAPAPGGGAFAGTSPDGRILRISASGQVTTLASTGEKYVFALAPGKDGVYAATGPGGRLLHVSASGVVTEVAKLPETNVLSLSVLAGGDLLCGTGPDGLVYRVSPSGDRTVLFDAAEANATGAVMAADGALYVSTAPSGRVYRVEPSGRSETLIEKPDGNVLALTLGEGGTVYAGGGQKVYRIAPDKTVATLDCDDQNQFTSIAIGPGGTLYAGSANTGAVYRAAAVAAGTLTSSVLDAGLKASWGRADVTADTPEGTSVAIETRSGNVTQPDATWSGWQPQNGGAVASPPARFLQYRATLTPSPSGATPLVRSVGVRYLTENRAPTVKVTGPKDSDRWSGKKTVKWTGTDPDSDVLTYDVHLSSDGGATWTALDKAAKPSEAKPAAGGGDDSAKPAPATKPEEKKDAEKATGTTKSQYAWDTAGIPDGTYRIKVVATDRASNASGHLSAEDVSGVFVVSNSKPKVTPDGKGPSVAEGRKVVLTGTAVSSTAPLVRVSYRVDGGEWLAAAAADGIFDSTEEAWTVVSDSLPAGEHKLEVRATDEAENNGTSEVKAEVK